MVKGLLGNEHLKSLIKGVDKQGCLPLHSAVQFSGTKITELLLAHDKNTACIRNYKEGMTALHLAVQNGRTSMVDLLLKYNRKAAYIRDNEGRTALHLAASRFKIFKMIISYCPDCAEIVDKTGKNALHYASSNGFRGLMARISMEIFTIMNPSLINLYNEKDVDGNTPFHLYCKQGVDGMKSGLLSYLSRGVEMGFIIHPGVKFLAFNKENRTATEINYDRKVRILSRNSTFFLFVFSFLFPSVII